jgi:hypothetical protein
MKRHLWIGLTLVALALALGGGLWLRQGFEVPFAMSQPGMPADPAKDAVMKRLRQEQAEALSGEAAGLPADPQAEDVE